MFVLLFAFAYPLYHCISLAWMAGVCLFLNKRITYLLTYLLTDKCSIVNFVTIKVR